MDWVDFKRNCARYREPYHSLSEHCTFLLVNAIHSYSEYRHMSLSGYPDYSLTAKFGQFMAYIAEIESLTIHYDKNKATHDSDEFAMLKDAIAILSAKLYTTHKTCDDIILYCSQWARKYFGVVYNNRHYTDAMKVYRRELQDKYGY